MSLLARFSASMRNWLADRSARWRTRDGTLVGAPEVRGIGLPIRLALWALLGLGLFFGLRYAIFAIAPAGDSGPSEAPTPVATLYVACTDPQCRFATTTRQPMNFSGWPLNCERCGKSSVQRATLCPRCNTWIARAGDVACWRCAELRAASQPKKPPRKPGANPDDDEDGW